MRLRAFGKVNLTLRVLGVRPDGYHLLHSYVQSVSIWDELVLETPGEPGTISLHVESEAAVPGGEGNLAWRAAQAVRARAGCAGLGVSISLRKGIPVAAGMAGGSADAAAVLVGLNRLWNLGLGEAELLRLGLGLGADVPFCLRGGLALMEGIGEKLTPLEPPGPLPLVLVYVQAALSTAGVYSAYDAGAGEGSRGKAPPLMDPAEFLARWKAGPQELAPALHNDLEAPATALCPEIGRAKAALLAAGALAAVMSGSGPTVVGLCRDEERARHVAGTLQGAGWRASPVSIHPVGVEVSV